MVLQVDVLFQFKGIIALSLISSCLCQYYQEQSGPQYRQTQEQYYRSEPSSYGPSTPPPQILMHKQAQTHDGGFKYAFAAENGLAQGESINPDGTRTGGYSYVDPNGKKISVKYTAGKEGFKILEGDHIPKAPIPVAPVPQQSYTAPQAYPAYQQRDGDDGQYRPEKYEAPAAPAYAYQRPAPYAAPVKYTAPLINRAEGNGNALDEKEYNDEPGKPYSFGKGYSFEFGG